MFKVPLVTKATPLSALGMHPPAEDNFGSDATSLLVLPTDPPCLVIANANGVLHHCVYLDAGEVGSRPLSVYTCVYIYMYVCNLSRWVAYVV